MSLNRRYPEAGETIGPSDEMLAVDAASEIRSLSLLYDRYADRLYRFFLVCTGDPDHAERMLRRLLQKLPDDLRRYNREERTFPGWLFAGASALVLREHSLAGRLARSASRIRIPGAGTPATSGYAAVDDAHSPLSVEKLRRGLGKLRPADREAVGLVIGAGLATIPASEAMRLPASLISAHVQRAIQALAEELDAANPQRFQEDVERLLGDQALTHEQRSAHLALIHSLLRGEMRPETDAPSRVSTLEVAGLVVIVVLGLAGIWVWGELTTGDTREHEVPAAVGDGDGDAVDAAASNRDPTSTPDVEAQLAGEGAADTCLAADGIGAFHRFVNRYNEGDFTTVRSMLPSHDYDHPLLEVDPVSQQRLQSMFRHHDARLGTSGDIIAYLRERHAAGERWEVLEAYPAEQYRNRNEAAPLEMYQDWNEDHPGLSMVVVSSLRWLSPDGREEIASGQVVVDCASELIIQWDLRRDNYQTGKSISVDDFMAAMTPLNPGESRQIRSRVRTDMREDGGELSTWEVVLSEAAGQSSELLRRIVIRTLDGAYAIGYLEDGSRWLLDWRGWVVSGDMEDDEQPMPEEIAQSMSVLQAIPGLIGESRGEIDQAENVSLTRDDPEATGISFKRRFEVTIRRGTLVTARLLEEVNGSERARPELTMLDVNRSAGDDPGEFEAGIDMGFPENLNDGSRFEVPDDEWPELRLISMNVGNNPVREQYRLSWNGVLLDLAVWPSRGGVDLASIPQSADESWITAVTTYSHGSLVWAHRQFAGYPTDALWDDGRYRFELAVDRGSVQPEHGWDIKELIRLADALSGSADDSSLLRDRGRGRTSHYPDESMFNH